MTSVESLRLFHAGERRLYERLLDLGIDPSAAKRFMALWLWLESVGHHDVLIKIHSSSDEVVLRVAAEAERCYAFLGNTLGPDSRYEIPIMARITGQPITLHDFELHRHTAIRGISTILTGVCSLIFNDIIARRGLQVANQILALALTHARTAGEGTSQIASLGADLGALSPLIGTVLDPLSGPSYFSNIPLPADLVAGSMIGGHISNAFPDQSAPYVVNTIPNVLSPLILVQPRTDFTSEEERCLFVTFSRGHPLTREEIINFFTQSWGECVANVYLEDSNSRDGPLYGRVVFYTQAMVHCVLNGREKVKFTVNGRPLWARQFKPRRERST